MRRKRLLDKNLGLRGRDAAMPSAASTGQPGATETETETALVKRAARLPPDLRELLLAWLADFQRARVREYYQRQFLRRYNRTPSTQALESAVVGDALGGRGARFWPELVRYRAAHECTSVACSFSRFTLDCIRCGRAPPDGYVALLASILQSSADQTQLS
jgi:hypothetical protein